VSQQVVIGYQNLQVPPGGTLVAIGNFDGVHRGHQALIAHALEEARARSLLPVAMTFDPHPSTVLGKVAPTLLTSTPRKIELLRAMSPELRVIVQPFTDAFSHIEAEDFVTEVLLNQLRARHVMVGKNFHFGRGRRGNHELLTDLAMKLGFSAHAFELSGDYEGSFSSSRARAELLQGRLDHVTSVLGRPHAITGDVVRGNGLGRQFGFPTANLANIVEGLPPPGVYAAMVDEIAPDGQATSLGPSVMSIGPRPTVNLGETVEVHLLDFSGDLYGKQLRAHLVARQRGIEKFANVEELKVHIQADIDEARSLLAKWVAASGDRVEG
jgi:riboflavin kinase/FMN adenylyltransferase